MLRLCNLRAEAVVVALWSVLAVLLVERGTAIAAQDGRPLQLEVYINDAPVHLIGTFTQFNDGKIAARRAELAELGLNVSARGSGHELVIIDEVPGMAHRYDERSQTIFFTVGDQHRVRHVYDARGDPLQPTLVRPDYGGLLNYTLFAASTNPFVTNSFNFSGANASLDGRLFGPHGTLSQSAILGSTTTRETNALRLETTWSFSDPETLMTYRAGDTISGGLAWTRPLRLGGIQVQRNFALRPDLLTFPLPAISGSAAVPSTVDVYVNNVRTLSKEVSAGPYEVTNVPTLGAGGTARVVVRDAAGRETQTSLPFYVSPKLLRPGLMEFSGETGVPRFGYGVESNRYDDEIIGSASLRAGLFDGLTIEGHAEGGADLLNGGVGVITSVGPWGVLSLSGSASQSGDHLGAQGYLAYNTQFSGIFFHASSQRTFGTYSDIAAVTARHAVDAPLNSELIGTSGRLAATILRPPKALDTVSVGFPLGFDRSTVSVGYLHLVPEDARSANIVNASYSRPIFDNAAMFASAYTDVSNGRNSGVFFGVSIPIGPSVSASTGLSRTQGAGTNVTLEANKPIQPEPGSYGWRVIDREGNSSSRYAAGSYRSTVAKFDATALQAESVHSGDRQSGARFSGQVEGAIATLGGSVFLSNRIDDSFAVVDAGAPNVGVLYENRPLGRTDNGGQILIPNLQSYRNNKISIDARDLPVDADAPITHNVLAPVDRGGILVDFAVKTGVSAAVVILSDRTGKLIAPGSRGRVQGTIETFVVGYDGRAFIKGLGASNAVVVTVEGGECRASFPFTPTKNDQVVVGPVVCQ